MLFNKSLKLNNLFNDVLNWENDLWSPFGMINVSTSYNPAKNSYVEMCEIDGKIKYTVDLPGVNREQVALTHEGNYIKIASERTDKNTISKFSTTFTISPKAKIETLEAVLTNGVLSISFDTKAENESVPEARRIEIKESPPKLGM